MPPDQTTRPLALWRDSVAAGDDAGAPHERTVPTPPNETVGRFRTGTVVRRA